MRLLRGFRMMLQEQWRSKVAIMTCDVHSFAHDLVEPARPITLPLACIACSRGGGVVANIVSDHMLLLALSNSGGLLLGMRSRTALHGNLSRRAPETIHTPFGCSCFLNCALVCRNNISGTCDFCWNAIALVGLHLLDGNNLIGGYNGHGWLLETILEALGAILEPPGLSWGCLGAILGPLGAILGPLGAILELSWGLLGRSWGHLGASWSHSGASWSYLGASGGDLGAILGQLGALLGPSWGLWGPSWGHLGPILGPSWGHLGANLGPTWALKPRKIRCVRHFARKAQVSMVLCLVLSCLGDALAT